jgi:hypothetical protein
MLCLTRATNILSFYGGETPDHRHRYLRDIQQWPDDRLEETHDYIQWVFPLAEPSGFNPHAPILDQSSIREFRLRSDLQENLRISLLRMLAFYGFSINGETLCTVELGPHFAEKSALWMHPANHNHLRIRRILKSMQLLGPVAPVRSFFDCLAEIYRVERARELPGISDETFSLWQKAVR